MMGKYNSMCYWEKSISFIGKIFRNLVQNVGKIKVPNYKKKHIENCIVNSYIKMSEIDAPKLN